MNQGPEVEKVTILRQYGLLEGERPNRDRPIRQTYGQTSVPPYKQFPSQTLQGFHSI